MRKKFSKTLTFELSRELAPPPQLPSTSSSVAQAQARQRKSVDMHATRDESRAASAHQTDQHTRGQTLDSRVPSDYANQPGLVGTFVPIKNDFSILLGDLAGPEPDDLRAARAETVRVGYRDEAHWSRETKERVQRIRFVICILALFGLALGLMSRLILNVSIVQMVRDSGAPVPAAAHLQTPPPTVLPIDFEPETSAPPVDDREAATGTSDDPFLYAATEGMAEQQATATTLRPSSGFYLAEELPEGPQGDGLHFDWSTKDVNIILGAFYMGYAPSILFSGGLAQRYGAKWPLFVCIFGSALLNLFTPAIARAGLYPMVGSRVALGLVQGSLLPSLYELFNRWLTPTEANIFAPLIKVSMPMGSLMGSVMPAITSWLKLDWPNLFHVGGVLCFAWALAWALLATSLPQDNNLVGVSELHRIMRKKNPHLRQQASVTDKPTSGSGGQMRAAATSATETKSTPWLKIVTNPSVLALTAVKFTYNIGMDFIFLQVAVYLSKVHGASIETISAVASSGYCMQMLLIALVGWLAKVVVLKRALGFSVTKWRKVFQGGSNFLMAFIYLVLAYTQPEFGVAAGLLLLVCFFWMLGAGGESMVPYDLSCEYPASIVGFAHSVSIFSGITLTAMCDLVIGDGSEDPATSWSLLFYLISGALALGGLIFVTFLKAKPFLPGEKAPRPKQQVPSISRAAQQWSLGPGNFETGKLNGFR